VGFRFAKILLYGGWIVVKFIKLAHFGFCQKPFMMVKEPFRMNITYSNDIFFIIRLALTGFDVRFDSRIFDIQNRVRIFVGIWNSKFLVCIQFCCHLVVIAIAIINKKTRSSEQIPTQLIMCKKNHRPTFRIFFYGSIKKSFVAKKFEIVSHKCGKYIIHQRENICIGTL
jgi:hypothetical protein